MSVPSIYPWCCHDSEPPVTLRTDDGATFMMPFCVVMRIRIRPSMPRGCCQCLPSEVRLRYLGPGAQWTFDGRDPCAQDAPFTMEAEAVWQGEFPETCGLSRVTLAWGRRYQIGEHGTIVFRGWALVFHRDERPSPASGLHVCVLANPLPVVPERPWIYAADWQLRSRCSSGGRLAADIELVLDDPCVQSPERCQQPDISPGLCSGNPPEALLVRFYGPPDHAGCRLDGQTALVRRDADGHGHGHEAICPEDVRRARYRGTLYSCSQLPDYELEVELEATGDLPPEFRMLARTAAIVRVQQRGSNVPVGSWNGAARGRCEELWGKPLVGDGMLWGLQADRATIEPVSSTEIDFGRPSGWFCPYHWEPPCPRPARLILELERLPGHDHSVSGRYECVVYHRVNLVQGQRVVVDVLSGALPQTMAWELDVLEECCAYRGTGAWSAVEGDTFCGGMFARSLLMTVPQSWIGRAVDELWQDCREENSPCEIRILGEFPWENIRTRWVPLWGTVGPQWWLRWWVDPVRLRRSTSAWGTGVRAWFDAYTPRPPRNAAQFTIEASGRLRIEQTARVDQWETWVLAAFADYAVKIRTI